MGQQVKRFRGCDHQTGFDTGSIQLGRGEQGSQVIMQITGQPVALVFSCGLQVMGQIRQLRGAQLDFSLQPVTFGLDLPSRFKLLRYQCRSLAQVHQESQQAGGCQCCHPYTADQQRLKDRIEIFCKVFDLKLKQFVAERTEILHLLPANISQEDGHGRLVFAPVIKADRRGQFR